MGQSDARSILVVFGFSQLPFARFHDLAGIWAQVNSPDSTTSQAWHPVASSLLLILPPKLVSLGSSVSLFSFRRGEGLAVHSAHRW